MRVTLKQVAQTSGVSMQTVSRILNGAKAHLYREETQKLVRDTAAALGYRPNVSAQAIRTGRSNCVGLFFTHMGNIYHVSSNFMLGTQTALAEHNMNAVLAMLPAEDEAKAQLPAVLQHNLLDGLLITHFHRISPPVEDLIATQMMPKVWLNSKREFDAVYPNDRKAAQRATEYLLARGHTRITYVDVDHGFARDSDWHYSVLDRQLGYETAMRSAGLTPQAIRPDGLAPTKLVAAIREILAPENRPTAIVCYAMAPTGRSVMDAAHDLGLEIPTDLSFTSFAENIQIGWDRRVTTCVVPHDRMAREGVDMLVRKIEGSSSKREKSIILDCELVEGETVL